GRSPRSRAAFACATLCPPVGLSYLNRRENPAGAPKAAAVLGMLRSADFRRRKAALGTTINPEMLVDYREWTCPRLFAPCRAVRHAPGASDRRSLRAG